MTLRLPPTLNEDLKDVAAAEHRSVHAAVVHAVECYLAERETDEVLADAETLRSLAEARDAVEAGDLLHGTDAVHALVSGREDT